MHHYSSCQMLKTSVFVWNFSDGLYKSSYNAEKKSENKPKAGYTQGSDTQWREGTILNGIICFSEISSVVSSIS